MGLAINLMNADAPVHLKVLELHRKKQQCEATISNMRGLLDMMVRERDQLDGALNELIKETAQALSRSSSAANLEDLANAGKASLSRTNSACNLEEMASNAEQGLARLAGKGVF